MIAYLVMSYTHPELVRRLVARLQGGVVAVHHDDRRSTLGDVDALLIPPRPIEWGHGSQLAAILRCLDWLRSYEWDWLVLLSGQDYPVRPVPEIEVSLLATDVDAFIRFRPVPPRVLRRGAVDEFARRYAYRWRKLKGPDPFRFRLDPLVQVRTLPSGTYVGLPARPPLPVFHGSDWFSLSRRAVDTVLAAPEEVVDHFLHTIIPTEAFVHTVLANSGLRLANDHRRYAVFDPPSSPSPRVFGLADVGEVLASGADFARKFEDERVLDEIDRRIP
ncbi:beta-1,6-N-acetylglucosaminyltransferase [Solirubrobacter soli]|uniref:beta-1,6-N-acetylglucosaminyltransferase n=1 Tax=Solirubrobacter soli TaxID=363832 RepID=UPI000400BD9C|nr:beta-1,6-N-acetylglucosaminyltransferase [Solirubrobacter soli]